MITSQEIKTASALIGTQVLYSRERMATAEVTVRNYRINFGRIDYQIQDSQGALMWVRASNIKPIAP